jgi:hypothetical protein
MVEIFCKLTTEHLYRLAIALTTRGEEKREREGGFHNLFFLSHLCPDLVKFTLLKNP